MRHKIIATDFDGTLCEIEEFPKIGKPKQSVIDALLREQKAGTKLILWTCREGKPLLDAIKWCYERGLVFDAVNAQLPEMVKLFGNDCRKVFAHEYWDDRAVNVRDVS